MKKEEKENRHTKNVRFYTSTLIVGMSLGDI